MSTETIHALEIGEIDPITYWARHLTAWRDIAATTPLDDVEEMYTELKDNAADVVEFLAFLAPISLN